jgi:hypothetical protein
MNSAEMIANTICTQSFLSFWSFPNPIRKDNSKELTDILVVCDPYVIILSVKEIAISPSGEKEVDSKRWYKRAITKSYKQLYGAERIISQKFSQILTADKRHEILFPSPDKMKLFRIGISLGRRQDFALPYGHFETGFVHFFDQFSFPILLNELDTITDLTDYLKAKELFFDSGKSALFGSEEDLLAIYLHRGRRFPEQLDSLYVAPFVWDEFSKKSEMIKRKEQEKKSYIWDRIIEELFLHFSKGELLFSSTFSETEEALRAIARESRFSRMMLADSFLDFIGFYALPKARARLEQSPSGTTYVFFLDDHRENNRDQRLRELRLRCLAARNVSENSPEVVGIATNPYVQGGGHSYDLCYLSLPALDSDKKQSLTRMQQELGYFTKPKTSSKHYDEYPK